MVRFVKGQRKDELVAEYLARSAKKKASSSSAKPKRR